MKNFTIRPFTPADSTQLVELQQAYASRYPGAPVYPVELYLSPAFHYGQDVTCALVKDSGEERIVAYAPVYAQILSSGPSELPNRIWTEIKARPGLTDADIIKDALLEHLTWRAQELVQPFPERAARLIFEYRTHETEAIQYVQSRGFQYAESVFTMHRSLNAPFPSSENPQGIEIRRWKMESEPEQRAYVAARNECFPEAPITLEEWQYYLRSPQWAVGTMIAAISGRELVGAVQVYWNEEGNQQAGRKIGFTEDIFVREPWRKRGIARAAIVEGMRYLKENQLEEAVLNVRALNENALGLYKELGFQVGQVSRFYAKDL